MYIENITYIWHIKILRNLLFLYIQNQIRMFYEKYKKCIKYILNSKYCYIHLCKILN